MLDLNATQQALVASSYKEIAWLFEVTTQAPVTHYWSTRAVSFGGKDYAFRIPAGSWRGITLNRARSEMGIQAPCHAAFTTVNSDGSLNAADFAGATVKISLLLSDGTDTAVVAAWRFAVERCVSVHSTLEFICTDLLSGYLDQDWPKTPLVSALAPASETVPDDGLCVPEVFGTAYIPLRPLYVDGARWYLLGPSSVTYTITAVHAPRGKGDSEWTAAGGFAFTQATKTLADGNSYRMFHAIVADSDNDGTADDNGVWAEGDRLLDMPTKFSRSDTSSKTNPADVIAAFLEDLGVSAAFIDTGAGSSFEAAAAEFTSRGISWNGGADHKEGADVWLSRLLIMCHATIRVTDKIELHPLSAASNKTLGRADICRQSADGPSSYAYTPAVSKRSDSGYVALSETGKSQDALQKILVPAKTTDDAIAGTTLLMPWIADTQAAQKLGQLAFQRQMLQEASASFAGKATLLAVQPDDVVTIDHADYGGAFDALVDRMAIGPGGAIEMACIRFSAVLDNWNDLAPAAVTFADDATSGQWVPVFSGPGGAPISGRAPNVLRGRLRVGATGDHVIIDGDNKTLQTSDYSVGSRGWSIGPELAEFNNLLVRGTIRSAVFEYNRITANSGTLTVVPGADILDADMTSADSETVTIRGDVTFTVGDLLRIKEGADDEWMTVTGIGSAPAYSVTRDAAGRYAANGNPAWKKGAAVINYGPSGSGGVNIVAGNASRGPVINIFSHAGSPWVDSIPHVRLGDLYGFLSETGHKYGIAIGQADAYFKYNPTDGISYRGPVNDRTPWEDKTANFTAEANKRYRINSTGVSSIIYMVMPPNPSENDTVTWIDSARYFGTRKLRIQQNPTTLEKIEGSTDASGLYIECDWDRCNGTFIYTGSAYGWRLL